MARCNLIIVLVLMLFALGLSSQAYSSVLTLSDQEIFENFAPDFPDPFSGAYEITDSSGPGVQFEVDGITDKIGFSDSYEVSSLAGGTGSHNAVFTEYQNYELLVSNQGSAAISASLYMNTGFTGSCGNNAWDTFWGGSWVSIKAGETKKLELLFSSAETYNAEDDTNTDWQYTDGSWNPIHRLHQVTNIGFQVSPQSGTAADITVSAVPLPSAGILLMFGLMPLFSLRKRYSQQ